MSGALGGASFAHDACSVALQVYPVSVRERSRVHGVESLGKGQRDVRFARKVTGMGHIGFTKQGGMNKDNRAEPCADGSDEAMGGKCLRSQGVDEPIIVNDLFALVMAYARRGRIRNKWQDDHYSVLVDGKVVMQAQEDDQFFTEMQGAVTDNAPFLEDWIDGKYPSPRI